MEQVPHPGGEGRGFPNGAKKDCRGGGVGRGGAACPHGLAATLPTEVRPPSPGQAEEMGRSTLYTYCIPGQQRLGID